MLYLQEASSTLSTNLRMSNAEVTAWAIWVFITRHAAQQWYVHVARSVPGLYSSPAHRPRGDTRTIRQICEYVGIFETNVPVPIATRFSILCHRAYRDTWKLKLKCSNPLKIITYMAKNYRTLKIPTCKMRAVTRSNAAEDGSLRYAHTA